MGPRKINIQVLMYINSRIPQRIHELIHKIARGQIVRTGDLGPRMASGEPVAWGEDELRGACGADMVDGYLVVLEDELGWHIVRLVVDTEYDIGICCEALGEFTPELAKLEGGCCCGI